MFRGLYTAGWGMLSRGKSMDVIANNLANVNTNGYKKDTVVFESFPDVLARRVNDSGTSSEPTRRLGNMKLGADVGEVFTNYGAGQIQKTDNNFDMCIQNSDRAFFTVGVRDANGDLKEYFTKDGNFTIDANGNLVTHDGNPVLGERGIISVKTEDFEIKSDGTVQVDGNVIDKLKMAQFQDTRGLTKHGNNLIWADENEPKEDFTGIVRQGYIEGSNVNTIREMVDMISILRSYESTQKVIQSIDQTMEKTVNEVGTVR